MASPAGEALPALPPIKTAPLATSSSSPAPDAGEEEDVQEPSTPTSEDSRLRTPTECPPAPRKPPPPRLLVLAKRKNQLPPSPLTPARRVTLVRVRRDLSSVFMALPPPKKRIRVG